MSIRGKLKRYLLILERLETSPSLDNLLRRLHDHGHEVSARTLQRDLDDLRNEFGVAVTYDRDANTYAIAEGMSDDIPSLMQLLSRAQLLELVQDDGQGVHDLHRFVQFEGLGQLQGIQYLAPLMRAARNSREVRMQYQKFGAAPAKAYRLHPHLLKEFRGRWYVLGLVAGQQQPMAFGLDRIQTVTTTNKRFKRRDALITDLYCNAIGVDTSPGNAERILLRFKPAQAPYIKALPLHASQQTLEENAHGITISLFVMPNYELHQILLGLGNTVRVLEPKYLAKEIQRAHREAAKQYG